LIILTEDGFKTCSYILLNCFYNRVVLRKIYAAVIHTALYLYIYINIL